jgi:hypothetical protein
MAGSFFRNVKSILHSNHQNRFHWLESLDIEK